jgi:hypothetical protein
VSYTPGRPITPEQREQLLNLQMCMFTMKNGRYVFKTLSNFPFMEYERDFETLDHAIEHAKEVLLQCGSDWNSHPRVDDLHAWLTEHVGVTGGSIEFPGERQQCREFMIKNGVEQEFFGSLNHATDSK